MWDVMTGGTGRDTFIFTDISDSGIGLLRDIITDFTRGEDKISLARIDAIVGTGDDPFTFFGRVSPQGIDGELRYHFVTG